MVIILIHYVIVSWGKGSILIIMYIVKVFYLNKYSRQKLCKCEWKAYSLLFDSEKVRIK